MWREVLVQRRPPTTSGSPACSSGWTAWRWGRRTAAPYQFSWNTTLVANGMHTITAEGHDLSNNTATATMTVAVHNTPVNTAPHYLELDGLDDYLEVGMHRPELRERTAQANDDQSGSARRDRPAPAARRVGDTTNQEYQLQVVSGYLRFDRDNSTQGSATVSTVGGFNGSSVVASPRVSYDGRGGSTRPTASRCIGWRRGIALARRARRMWRWRISRRRW